MASDPTLSIRIDNARTDQNTLNATKQKLNENLADIVLLKQVFSNWENAYNSNGGDNAAAYQEALKSLPSDNPDTPDYNESVSEGDFIKKAEQYFGKSWQDINPKDVDGIQNDLQTIQNKVREYLGKSASVDMELDDTETEIDDLTAIQKSQGEIDDGGDDSGGDD